MNATNFHRLGMLAMLSALLGLAACGGDSNSAGDNAGAVPAPPAAPPAAAEGLALQPATLLIDSWGAAHELALVALGGQPGALAIEVVEAPRHGVLETDDATLKVVYRPTGAGFFNDTFTVRVADGEQVSAALAIPVNYADANGNGLPDFADPAMGTATALKGMLTENTHLLAGTYVVDGALEVAAHTTLRIEPGVTVLFRDGAYLDVGGAFIADASHQALVRMLPADIDPAGWLGLRMRPGSAPTVMVGDAYQAGSLFRGMEFAGVAETGQWGAVVTLCPTFAIDQRFEYLFEEVLIHSTLGDQGTRFIDKCAWISSFPHIVVRRSLFVVDDRDFAGTAPTQVFSAGRVDMQDSAVVGYLHDSMNYAWWAAAIDHSLLQLLPAAADARPGVSVTFGFGPGYALTNSLVEGTVFIDAAAGPTDALVAGNAFVQPADAPLFEVFADARDRTSIALGANHYTFSTSEAAAVIDGNTVARRAVLDFSSRLVDAPAAGPRAAAMDALHALAEQAGLIDEAR